ncbi:MAG: GAF domain-containing protein [Chloroflexi bacterium]|nr:GAF domain-containing protein [Chloroflexota bacterium]
MKEAKPFQKFTNRPLRPGGLARRIIWRLMAATLIPLVLIAGAVFFRTRQALEGQAVNQMQNLVLTEMGAAQEAMKVKQIRLDHISRRTDFIAALEIIIREPRGAPAFNEARDKAVSIFEVINREEGNPIFNLYFIADPNGTILVSSERKFEGTRLTNFTRYVDMFASDDQSYGVFDFVPFRPGEFTIVTVNQFQSSDGATQALIGGVSDEQYAVAILKSIVDLTPSSRAYFISHFGGYVGFDPYTGGMKSFTTVKEQTDKLADAINAMKAPGVEFAPATVKYKNESGVSVIAQVIWLEELKTGVALEVPEDSIFGDINELVPFLLVIFFAASFAMGFTIIWIANQVVRPIRSLADITSQFAQGKFSERANITSRDELGTLASSFNRMADELNAMYQSLREQVAERTRQIRTAAEVAQGLTSTFKLDELLDKTVRLIVERFGFYHAGIFMIDPTGTTASLRAAHGPSAEEMLKHGHQLEVGSDSIVGWASSRLEPRVAADVERDPVHHKNPLLPETRAEAGIPIALGQVALGVLDVQSVEPFIFDDEMIIVLQTLANQIAVAIQNASLEEGARAEAPEIERMYRQGLEIVGAETVSEMLEFTSRALNEAPNPTILLQMDGNTARVIAVNHPLRDLGDGMKKQASVDAEEAARQISPSLLVSDLSRAENAPATLVGLLREIGCRSGAFLPVFVQNRLVGIALVGDQPGRPLTMPSIRPFINITNLLGSTLEKIEALQSSQARLTQLEAISSFNQAALSSANINMFYSILQEQVQRVIGNYSFVVALYDEKTNSISIPYLYEDGRIQKVDPFPLGEGLTSVIIRSRQPLLLVENTERQALALGAKIHGKAAKSWMGVPLLVNEQPIGALIVQDLENERRFDESHLRFLVELGAQMAGSIQNVRLLEQSRTTALQLQTAAEIARDISGSLNLDELLLRGVNLIRERFNFYHASVFLLDLHGEFALIREATGEAGAQLKRTGHKLAVGSKSIVGYVTGRGESLVVNDTLKDATYFANPVLPDTRSEAAIPLKVGERILGALDVQSGLPYAFNDENLRTLEILADQLAVAVVNTELFAETQEHLSQHRLLHHITTSAASGATLEEALETTVRGLQVTLGGDRVSILLLDRDRKMLEMRAFVGYAEDASAIRIPLGTGITGWAATHRKPLRVDDVTHDARYIQVSENTRSELAIPLIYRNELLGIVNVESEQVAAYTENDEEMLGTLAGSLAAVIANARLLAQIRRQAERERMLYEVTSKIRRSVDVRSILATTASELTRAVGARYTQIKITSEQEAEPSAERSSDGA